MPAEAVSCLWFGLGDVRLLLLLPIRYLREASAGDLLLLRLALLGPLSGLVLSASTMLAYS